MRMKKCRARITYLQAEKQMGMVEIRGGKVEG